MIVKIATLFVLLGLAAVLATPSAPRPQRGADACDATLAAAQSLPNEGQRALVATGEARAGFVFVDFTDFRGREAPAAIGKLFVPKLVAWYRETSYGRFTLEPTVTPTWHHLSRASTDYSGSGAPLQFLDDAAAATTDVDYHQFDLVYVVVPREVTTPGFQLSTLGPPPSEDSPAGAAGIRHWTLVGSMTRRDELAYAPHVLVHETGHILGLTDLYGFAPVTPRYAGPWDVMSMPKIGAQFTAWNKWMLGWLRRDQLACAVAGATIRATLTPLETPTGEKAVVVPRSRASVWVVELRRRLGVDRGLCADGVLVYSADATTPRGAGPVRVVPAQRDNPRRVFGCGLLYNATLDRKRAPRLWIGPTARVELLRETPQAAVVRVTWHPAVEG